jgi:hypothetical protein
MMMDREWDTALRDLRLVDNSSVCHDTPTGSCWYCRRVIAAGEEKVPLPAELEAHYDCETVWMAAPCAPLRRDAYDDVESYYGDLEAWVHDMHATDWSVYTTEPRLQPTLDQAIKALYARAVRELLAGTDNPCRRPGEGDGPYLARVLSEDDEDVADPWGEDA